MCCLNYFEITEIKMNYRNKVTIESPEKYA